MFKNYHFYFDVYNNHYLGDRLKVNTIRRMFPLGLKCARSKGDRKKTDK